MNSFHLKLLGNCDFSLVTVLKRHCADLRVSLLVSDLKTHHQAKRNINCSQWCHHPEILRLSPPDVDAVQLLSCVQLFCKLMDCGIPDFLVLPYLLEFSQTHVHWVGDAISFSIAPFSCVQSFPASGSFPMSQLSPTNPSKQDAWRLHPLPGKVTGYQWVRQDVSVAQPSEHQQQLGNSPQWSSSPHLWDALEECLPDVDYHFPCTS